MDGIFALNGLVDGVKGMFQQMALLAIVVVLLLALLFFLPCVVSAMRDTALRLPVTVGNIAAIVLIPLFPPLAVILWLVLMAAAIVGKKKLKVIEAPDINIYTGAAAPPPPPGERNKRL
jgi:uncharacterized membrane protein